MGNNTNDRDEHVVFLTAVFLPWGYDREGDISLFSV